MTPEVFERGLKNHDSALSLRWGNAIGSWIVERRERIHPMEMKLLHLGASQVIPNLKAIEEYRSARNGCHVVAYINMLDNRVFDSLWYNDVQRWGVEMATRPLEREKRRKKEAESRMKDLDRQAGDVIHWAATKKTAVLEHEGGAEKLVNEAIGKNEPVFLGDNCHEVTLDLHGVSVVGEPQFL